MPAGEVIPTGFGQSTIFFGGFWDMNYEDKKIFKSATGVFDFTIFKAPTQVQFPKVYK
jgi:hypothetical protein